jgi:hypothetical protein
MEARCTINAGGLVDISALWDEGDPSVGIGAGWTDIDLKQVEGDKYEITFEALEQDDQDAVLRALDTEYDQGCDDADIDYHLDDDS